jgi:hypothetical protein
MRVSGWEGALNAVVEAHAALPFEWGVSDCFTLPLAGILAVTGRDPWPGLHDYNSEFGAAKCLVAQGFGSLADAFAARLQEIPGAVAGRGDVAIVRNEDGRPCGALYVGARLAGKAQRGLAWLPRGAALRSFKVQ